jgi:hypothetical protein
MKIRKMLGVGLLLVAAALAFLPIFAGFSMAGFHVGLFLFTGLGGLVLVIS